ncbi:MAG: hypothetical protein ACOYNS_05835 [Bacteroidota bacterium]
MNCASCGRTISGAPLTEDGYHFCNSICRYDWRKAGKPNPVNINSRQTSQNTTVLNELEYSIEPAGFENRGMRIQLSYWKRPTLILDGKHQVVSKSSILGRYREYTVTSTFGKNCIVRLRQRPLDIIPVVEIDGAEILIARPLTKLEYAWLCIPLIVLFGGGAVGGLLGGMATYSNSLLMRKFKSWIPRYIATGATTMMALMYYVKFVILVNPYLPEAGQNGVEEQLAAAVVEINRQCPQNIDDQTRLDSVSMGEGRSISYFYSLTALSQNEVDTAALRKYLFPRLVANAKTGSDMSFMRENLVSMVYHYSDKNGEKTLSFSIEPHDYQ